MDFERSYSGSSTSQNVVNDFPFYADYRRWETTPFDKNNYNASYNLKPGIRVLSEDDSRTMSVTLKYDDMRAKNDWWFIFAWYGRLVDSYRRKLTINWTSNETIAAEDYI